MTYLQARLAMTGAGQSGLYLGESTTYWAYLATYHSGSVIYTKGETKEKPWGNYIWQSTDLIPYVIMQDKITMCPPIRSG